MRLKFFLTSFTLALLAPGLVPASAADRPEAHATAREQARARPAVTVDPSRDSVIPYVFDGNGWSTNFVFTNLDNHTVNIQLEFSANDGSNLPLPVLGIGTTSTVAITLPVGGTISLVTGDFDPFRTSAYAFAQASNGADLFSGYAVVRNQSQGLPDLEFTVPLAPLDENFFVLPCDNTNGYTTQLALVNSSTQTSALVSLTLQDSGGNIIGADQISIPPLGRSSFSLTDTYPQLNNIVASVGIGASGKQFVTGFGLRIGPNGSITGIPPFSLRNR